MKSSLSTVLESLEESFNEVVKDDWKPAESGEYYSTCCGCTDTKGMEKIKEFIKERERKIIGLVIEEIEGLRRKSADCTLYCADNRCADCHRNDDNIILDEALSILKGEINY